MASSAPLTDQIPKLIDFHMQLMHAFSLRLIESLRQLSAFEETVFFLIQFADPFHDFFIFHDSSSKEVRIFL